MRPAFAPGGGVLLSRHDELEVIEDEVRRARNELVRLLLSDDPSRAEVAREDMNHALMCYFERVTGDEL